jgi:sorting nexin-29
MPWGKIRILMERVWKEEQMPEEWNSAIICPVHKKGNKMECNNYRGISLLNITHKIFAQLVAKLLEPYVQEILGDYQCGFRKGRSTTDQIFSLRMILEKSYEYNMDIHQLYIDHKQAYDSINRDQLIEIIKDFGIPSRLIRLVKMTLEKMNN